jgi:hypothetical protein
VVALWGETLVVGVYFSPNSSCANLEEYLGEVETAIRRHLPRPVLVGPGRQVWHLGLSRHQREGRGC